MVNNILQIRPHLEAAIQSLSWLTLTGSSSRKELSIIQKITWKLWLKGIETEFIRDKGSTRVNTTILALVEGISPSSLTLHLLHFIYFFAPFLCHLWGWVFAPFDIDWPVNTQANSGPTSIALLLGWSGKDWAKVQGRCRMRSPAKTFCTATTWVPARLPDLQGKLCHDFWCCAQRWGPCGLCCFLRGAETTGSQLMCLLMYPVPPEMTEENIAYIQTTRLGNIHSNLTPLPGELLPGDGARRCWYFPNMK